jgi:predicted DCC family thiol-disulfide oxidoreductase YuxK
MLSLLLLLANAGARFSMDSILRKRPGTIGRLASSLYYEFGVPPANTLQIAKFVTLGAYWCVCLYSLSMHLGEQSWMNGTAGPLLLSSKFLSRYAGEFTHFFQLGPWAVLMGRVAIWAMLPWYVLLLPFVLIGGFFRTYVIVWGLLFFTLSVLVLQLGWLGQFEFLLFAGLFWQRRFIATDRLQVAYDDKCNLCDRTVQFIKAVDLFRRVELRPLSSNVDWLRSHGIDPHDALTDLYGIKDGADAKPRQGYDFYLLSSGQVLLLLPFYPLLWIGQFIGGPAIYRFIADRRTRLFGVCEIASPKAQHRLLPADKTAPFLTGKDDPVGYFSVHMAVLCLFYLLALPAPYLGWPGFSSTGGMPSVISAFARAAHVYGVGPISVFNASDLRLTENWFTISAVGSDGAKTLLPIFAEDGSRLAMHRSDRVYFGYTLMFRRGMIGHTGCAFDHYKTLLRYLAERARSAASTSSFVYDQYFQPLPESAGLLAGSFATVAAQRVCEVQF